MSTWVLRLIVVNVGVFLLTAANPRVLGLLAFVPRFALVQPWTFVTYQFAHAGLGHLLFNMLGLFFFGSRLEAHLGPRHFLGLYLASGVAGALLSFLNFNTPIIGASAAVFGVFLGFARFWPRERVYIWGVLPVEARVLVVVMTVLALFGGFGFGGGGIAHFAHLGGFLGGWLYLRWAAVELAGGALPASGGGAGGARGGPRALEADRPGGPAPDQPRGVRPGHGQARGRGTGEPDGGGARLPQPLRAGLTGTAAAAVLRPGASRRGEHHANPHP